MNILGHPHHRAPAQAHCGLARAQCSDKVFAHPAILYPLCDIIFPRNGARKYDHGRRESEILTKTYIYTEILKDGSGRPPQRRRTAEKAFGSRRSALSSAFNLARVDAARRGRDTRRSRL
ncbi:hypothetical protein EVAR_87922_1 [Eumeta japonica]|uniref:Uncharacterized protein n=1 Tax=Eumeta variegata TaxID=151549 RepID=A0A4C1WTW0_EUMVA|nr:hypothetical protein EVAR_87922_1 [Eumeta japonica]